MDPRFVSSRIRGPSVPLVLVAGSFLLRVEMDFSLLGFGGERLSRLGDPVLLEVVVPALFLVATPWWSLFSWFCCWFLLLRLAVVASPHGVAMGSLSSCVW